MPFQCCAARIEDAAEHWFDRGPVVDAVLASAAVPGLLPRVRIDEQHYLDGGLVRQHPARAGPSSSARGGCSSCRSGASSRRSTAPRNPWEVGVVAFEIARRHRFARDMATVPDDVEVHVLPAGDGAAPRWNSREALRYRDFSGVGRRIDGAYRASADYLSTVRPMPLMAPKPLPPRWVRRVVLAPAMIGMTIALLFTLPLWLLVAAAASPLLPGPLPGLAGAVGRDRVARAGERVVAGAVRAVARRPGSAC